MVARDVHEESETTVLHVLKKHDDCFSAITPGTTTLAYLNNGYAFDMLWERKYLPELVANITNLTLCEITGDWVRGARQLLKGTGEDPVGFIVGGWPPTTQVPLDQLYWKVVRGIPKKPKVLIQLSDEDTKWVPANWYSRLVSTDGFAMRTYNNGFDLQGMPKTRIAPLGYNPAMNFGGDSCAAARVSTQGRSSNRHHLWAWVGTDHFTPFGSRKKIVSELLKVTEGSQLEQNNSNAFVSFGLPPDETFGVFRNSVFTVVLPGETTMESQRVYEAVIAGSIPVAVATESQISQMFGGHWASDDCESRKEGRPPFIFASSWTDAREQMEALADDQGKIDVLRAKLARWYCSWLHELQNELSLAFRTNSTKLY